MPTSPELFGHICICPGCCGHRRRQVVKVWFKPLPKHAAFPSGQSPLEAKLDEVRWVVEHGADEVDMVIDRGAFLSGRYAKVYDEIVQVKDIQT